MPSAARLQRQLQQPCSLPHCSLLFISLLLIFLLASQGQAWPYDYRYLYNYCPGPEWSVMCRGCCEYEVIRCKCPLQGTPVGYAVPCCRNARNDCDPCVIHPGCSIFENCKRCNNGTWGPRDNFFVQGQYCAECRPGWSGGNCMTCGGVIRKRQGHLVLESYPTNARCEWTLQVNEPFTVELRFMMLSLEFDHSCRYDYVEVRDGDSINSRVIGRFCGNERPPPIQSTGNSLHILFVSDGYKNFDGLFAIFQENSACTSSPCLHDGTCILDSSHSYHCACLAGYTGKRCEHVLACRSPVLPEHGSVESVDVRVGGQALFACQPGFTLKGFRMSTCMMDGSWSTPPPLCVPEKNCVIPPKPSYGDHFLVYGPNDVLIALQYLCYRPYTLIGTPQRTCLANHTWSGSAPACVIDEDIVAVPDKDKDDGIEKHTEFIDKTKGKETIPDKTVSLETPTSGKEKTKTEIGKDIEQEVGKDTGKGTDKDTGKDTGKDIGKETEKDTGKDTGKDIGKDSWKDTGKDTGKETEKETEKDTDKDTGKDTGKDTDKDTGKDTGKDTDKDTGKDTGKDTDKDTGKDTDKDTDKDTGKDTDKDTGKDTGKDTDKDTGKDTGKDTDKDTGKDTDKDTGKDTGKDTDKDTGKDTGKDTEKDTGKDTGKDSWKDTGKDPGKDIGKEKPSGGSKEKSPEDSMNTVRNKGSANGKPSQKHPDKDGDLDNGVKDLTKGLDVNSVDFELTDDKGVIKGTIPDADNATEEDKEAMTTDLPQYTIVSLRKDEKHYVLYKVDTSGQSNGTESVESNAIEAGLGTLPPKETQKSPLGAAGDNSTEKATVEALNPRSEGEMGTAKPPETRHGAETKEERPPGPTSEAQPREQAPEGGGGTTGGQQTELERGAENLSVIEAEGRKCPPLPRLYHGFYEWVPGLDSDTVEFFCNHSYALSGNARRSCLPNGTWDGTQPICVRACREPKVSVLVKQKVLPPMVSFRKTPVHKFYSSTGLTKFFGPVGPTKGPPTLSPLPQGFHHLYTHIEYECTSPYYHNTGSTRRTCLKTGKWSGRHVSCTPVCGKLPNFDPQHPVDSHWPWLAAIYRSSDMNGESKPGKEASLSGGLGKEASLSGGLGKEASLSGGLGKEASLSGGLGKEASLSGGLGKGQGLADEEGDMQAGSWQLVCSGALLNQRSVVVAAHCVTELGKLYPLDVAKVRVVLGKHYRSDLRQSRGLQRLRVSSITVHPNYDSLVLDSDLAILKLLDKARIGEHVLPICLPDARDSEIPLPRRAMVMGWSLIPDAGAGESERAHVGSVMLGDVVHCEQQYAQHGVPISVSENMLCGRQGPGASPSNICPAETGGVLILPPTSTPDLASQLLPKPVQEWKILGLVSFGYDSLDCNPELYTVYTQIANFIDFLEGNMK